jgi:GNAT superfamily N-acetyltransferase
VTTAPGALIVDPRPSAQEVQFLEDRINAFNVARTGVDDGRLLSIFVRDPSGGMMAGLYGWTWGGACEIRFLWVREDARGQGLGRRLLQTAEQEAIARGCGQVMLSTHTFQAPGFYQKLGYQVAGAFDEYPRGYQQIFLQKKL